MKKPLWLVLLQTGCMISTIGILGAAVCGFGFEWEAGVRGFALLAIAGAALWPISSLFFRG